MKTFDDFGLDTKVLNAIEALGYDKPTEIQAQAIEPANNGRDILGIAQTGSGKTAAFLLPLIKRLSEGRAKARMPRGLILTPTRELAAQIEENFNELAKEIKLSSTLIIGGTSYQEQKKSFSVGVDIIIGTPGRIYDHLERQNVMLHGIQFLVIDEADRMLDEGFIPQVEMICSRISPLRQTLFFSATMNPEIEKLGDGFLSDPLRIEVSPRASVSDDIEQLVFLVESRDSRQVFKQKRAILRKIISNFDDKLSNAIIFSNTKNNVDILQKSMKYHGYKSESIHGDHTQIARTEALTKFRNGEIQFLIASDVASRGLDIPLVSHIINLDVPSNPEDYIHRIGRTGRAGNKGTSVTLCSKKELSSLASIESLISQPLNKYKIVLKGRSQSLQITPLDEDPKHTRGKAKDMTAKDQESVDDAGVASFDENNPDPKPEVKKKNQASKVRKSKNMIADEHDGMDDLSTSADDSHSEDIASDNPETGPKKPIKRRWSYRKKDLTRRKPKVEASLTGTDAGIKEASFTDRSPSDETIPGAVAQSESEENDDNSRQKNQRKTSLNEPKKTKKGSGNPRNRGFEGRPPAFVFYNFD